jgi:hypothetical protein
LPLQGSLEEKRLKRRECRKKVKEEKKIQKK